MEPKNKKGLGSGISLKNCSPAEAGRSLAVGTDSKPLMQKTAPKRDGNAVWKNTGIGKPQLRGASGTECVQ